MAAAPTPADAKAEAAKMDLLEDDDEFEEFEIDQGTALPAALLP
jgi:26 proteasome complex subunit DSS1